LPQYYTAFSHVYFRATQKLSTSNICQINRSFLNEGRGKRQEVRGNKKSFEIVSFLATLGLEGLSLTKITYSKLKTTYQLPITN
jgi:hypothetical protein